jgi:hypothetical protein
MSEESDGTASRKVFLKQTLKHPSTQPIIDNSICKLSKIAYVTGMMFWYYISFCLINKLDFTITEKLLNRCTNMILIGSKPIGDVDTEIVTLKDVYRRHKETFDKVPQYNFLGATRPMEYFNTGFLANIINHVQVNFYKFQKRYVKAYVEWFLRKTFKSYPNASLEKPLKGKQVAVLVWLVQRTLNKSSEEIETDNKMMPPELLEKLLPHIKTMISKLLERLPEVLRDKVNHSNLKKNLSTSIRYFYHMSRVLTKLDKKSFSPVPRIGLHRHHFRFDSKYLCRIYNDWGRSMEDPETKDQQKPIGKTEFEKDYMWYRDQMFDFTKFYDSKKKPPPITFSTDAVSVSITLPGLADVGKTLLQQRKERAEKSYAKRAIKVKKKKSVKVKPKKDRIISFDKELPKNGLFEAADVRASDKTLERVGIYGIDPNNKAMLACVKDNGDRVVVTKGEYNELSHITLNRKKKEKILEASPEIVKINAELSEFCIKSSSAIAYNGYIDVVVNNWDTLWDYHLNPKLAQLDYDTYHHSKLAVAKLCRKIVGRKKNRKKPIILAIGKGAGNMTINNTKNSSAHGPIKRFIMALQLLVIVLLVDEYNTSKICSGCYERIKQGYTHHRMKYRTLMKKLLVNNPDLAKKSYAYKKRLLGPEKMQIVVKRESHGLCCCQNRIPLRAHRNWNRDHNSSRNMIDVAKRLLAGKDRGPYARPKVVKKRTAKKVKNTNIAEERLN